MQPKHDDGQSARSFVDGKGTGFPFSSLITCSALKASTVHTPNNVTAKTILG